MRGDAGTVNATRGLACWQNGNSACDEGLAIMTFTEAVVRFVRWLREGYPSWAPRHGYVPLIALSGKDTPPDDGEL
jgi:hypothetical protein